MRACSALSCCSCCVMRTPWAKNPGLFGKWRVLGRKRPCCRMLVMLPRGPVWPALMWTSSGEVEVARVAGGGKRRVAFWTRLGMVIQWYW